MAEWMGMCHSITPIVLLPLLTKFKKEAEQWTQRREKLPTEQDEQDEDSLIYQANITT